jgi:hypothetical protein
VGELKEKVFRILQIEPQHQEIATQQQRLSPDSYSLLTLGVKDEEVLSLKRTGESVVFS